MTYSQLILGTFLTGLLMFALRAVPFVLFAKKEPPKFLKFVEKYIPAIAIAVLFTVCLKEKTTDLMMNGAGTVIENFAENQGKIIAAALAAAATIGLHIWKNNAMISIFGGTILFMILKNFL